MACFSWLTQNKPNHYHESQLNFRENKKMLFLGIPWWRSG